MILEPLVAVAPAWYLTDPQGVVHDISEHILTGQEGRLMREVEILERPAPGRQGARLKSARFRSGMLGLPMFFQEDSALALWAKVRQVLRWFNPASSMLDDTIGRTITIMCRALDGAEREIVGVYRGGLEGQEEWGSLFVDHWLTAVQIWVGDAYWSDIADQTAEFDLATATPKGLFDVPFFPVQISSSSVIGQTYIDNTGDADAWPRWVITGPGSNPVLRNGTAALSITTTLLAGQQVVIDTTPGIKSVEDGNGNNLYQLVDGSLWPLRPGVNQIQVEINGATVDTLATLAYRRGWLSP